MRTEKRARARLRELAGDLVLLLASPILLPFHSSLFTSRLSLLTSHPLPPAAVQVPADLAAERAAYAQWLASARTSPYAAVAVVPVGNGVRLGPAGSDVPLDGLPPTKVTEQNGRLMLGGAGASRPLPRGRPVPIGAYTVVADGLPGRTALTVFGAVRRSAPPAYFAYDSALVLSVALEPSRASGTVRLLAPDGVEVEAGEAGTVRVSLGGVTTPLRVRRIPGDGEESDLEIYFRDATAGRGSYPAGRFVTLTPLPAGRYRLDLNRARNPFCAYSSVYACPVPWTGNTLPAEVKAGERYEAGAK